MGDHPLLLRGAIEHAKERLLIISPWVRRTAVDGRFQHRLRAAAARNVAIHIGYGIADSPVSKDTNHADAIGRITALANEFPNLCFQRLVNTHAKILIWDNSLVVTSFNWLSFAGRPDRPTRGEYGVVIYNDSIQSDALWSSLSLEIERSGLAR